jgi:hypothetical protein
MWHVSSESINQVQTLSASKCKDLERVERRWVYLEGNVIIARSVKLVCTTTLESARVLKEIMLV